MDGRRPRLVFGDDGSPAADVVWLWLGTMGWPGWYLDLVHARPPQGYAPVPPERAHPHQREDDDGRRLPPGSGVVGLRHLVAESDPRIVLDSLEDVDLLAIGARGAGLLKQLHLGSTAEWLLHHPPAPLLIVRSGRPTRSVLLCVDGSAAAQRAAETLARLPWLNGCRVEVLGVEPDALRASGRTPAEVARGIADAAVVLRGAGARVTERMVRQGGGVLAVDPRGAILDAVADATPDLVALGTRGLGGLARVLTGSTAAAVAHHAGCSVLVVP